ncbi:MAG: hypothetical protein H6822_22210 [Planctomycetaceae bacterium]|nr:hypothetical protein [Planctomycetaceae bacterium]
MDTELDLYAEDDCDINDDFDVFDDLPLFESEEPTDEELRLIEAELAA